MSLFGRLKNIFTSHPNSNNDNKKRQKYSYIKFDADPNELWEIVGELGDGAFGKVYKARHKVQQIFAALKQVDINDETELDDYSVEIDILNQCRHKNIVGLHEAFFFGGKLWMFIEFCGGGALDGIMLELEKPLTEPQIRYVCREMCEALDFLHQHFVIHRDLKAGNVLLTCEGEVKLADFGVSARNSSYRQKRDTFIGTPYWMAPEVILCETIKDSPYDFKSDIWSFGVTLIEFAQIEPPNHEMHPMRVLVKIQKSEPPTLKFPSRWSKEFNDFIAKCLVRDPDQRPTASDLLQHPFIRDVKDSQAIMELVSEANAEIIFEEKDLDDDLDEGIDLDGRSATTTDIDSDSISTTSGSNVAKPNGAEEDSVSDTSPAAAGDAGKVPLPAIVVGVGEKETPTVKKSSEVPVPAAADDKSSKTAESRESTPPESASPEDEEPVILRKKKPPPAAEMDKTPSTEEATGSPTGQKKYRTLTKTRKYVINGEVVMSKVSKIIVPGSSADKKQQEHQLWKADLRELKLLHKQEKKLLQDMELKSLAAIDEQNRKFEQDNSILLRNAENSLEQLTKQHKQQMDKMTASHATEMKNMQKKTRQEQDKDLKSFNESLKQELKLLKQEVDLMPKDVRRDTFQQRKKEKEIEHAEKERKFVELQKESMIRALKRVEDQQKDQVALAERQFLQLKQQTIRTREMSLWEIEVSQLKDRHRLNVQQLDSKFMLKKQLMMTRHAKEMEQVQRINASKEEELLQCHLLENKRLPKIMKNEGKTRALMFKQSLRISVMGITAEQEKERIKQFEETEKKRLKEEEARLRKKHKRQMDDLKAKNEAVVKELEQVHAEKRKMLDDNEAQKRKELEDQFQMDLNNMLMAQVPKKEALEAAFIQEMTDNEKFYANGSSNDQDSGKGLKSGVSQIISPNIGQVPATSAAKPPARITPESGKKLPTMEAPRELTLPVVTCSKTSAEHVPIPNAKTSEEKLPVPIAKAPEEKLPAPIAKAPEEKLPVSIAKAPDEKLPVPVAKAPEEKLPVPIVKEPEEKLPVSVTKVPDEKLSGPIAKAPEEKLAVSVAKAPEEKLPVPVVIAEPEEKLPVPVVKAPEEKLTVCADDSSVTVGVPVGGPSVTGPLGGPFVGGPSVCDPCVGVSVVPAGSEVFEEKKDTKSLVTAIPEEKVSCVVAVTANETQPTDGGISESKFSEPIVPCPTSSSTIALPGLPQHQEISSAVSTEQNSDAHLNVAVELLQTDSKAVVSGALPATEASSQDEGLVKEMGEPADEWEAGEENLSSAGLDVKIQASSVPVSEEAREELPVIPSSTLSLSSTSAESSVEKLVVAGVSGSQGQGESAVEENAAVFKCQTGMSPPSLSSLAQFVISTESYTEVPATDVPDAGYSHGHADLKETEKTKASLEVIDAHQEKSDSKLCETSYTVHEMQEVSLESSETQHEASSTAHASSYSHPEISDTTNEHSDPHQEESSSVQEQIESDHENCEVAHESHSLKSEEALEHISMIQHEESDTTREVCDSPNDKKDSADEKNSSSHDRCEKSDASLEFINLNPEKSDSSHVTYDGHYNKCSETQEESSSSCKTGDEEGVVDLSPDKKYDDSCDRSDPQDKQDMSSSHQQQDSNNLLECSESHLERDDTLRDEETGSSSIPLTSLVEASGASEEKVGRLHEKNESSDEKNGECQKNTGSTSLDKNESSVLTGEK